MREEVQRGQRPVRGGTPDKSQNGIRSRPACHSPGHSLQSPPRTSNLSSLTDWKQGTRFNSIALEEEVEAPKGRVHSVLCPGQWKALYFYGAGGTRMQTTEAPQWPASSGSQNSWPGCQPRPASRVAGLFLGPSQMWPGLGAPWGSAAGNTPIAFPRWAFKGGCLPKGPLLFPKVGALLPSLPVPDMKAHSKVLGMFQGPTSQVLTTSAGGSIFGWQLGSWSWGCGIWVCLSVVPLGHRGESDVFPTLDPPLHGLWAVM